MNPIQLLLEWRTDNIIRDFDINMENFSPTISNTEREKNWKMLKQKLISRGYIIIDKYAPHICYLIIKNIIWKNIIYYEIAQDNYCLCSLYNNCQYRLFYNNSHSAYFTREGLFRGDDTKFLDNINILEDIITKYLILLNDIITQYLIPDLSHITKSYMLDSILII